MGSNAMTRPPPPRSRRRRAASQRVHADVRADVDHHVARPQLGLDQREEPGLVGAGEVEGALEVVAQVEVEAQAAAAGADARRLRPPRLGHLPEVGHRDGPAAGDPVDALRVAARRAGAEAHRGRGDGARDPRPEQRRGAPRGVPRGSAAARCRASAGAPHADDAVPGHELAQPGDPADEPQLRPVARLDALDREARARADEAQRRPHVDGPQPRAVRVLPRRAVAALVEARAQARPEVVVRASCRARPRASTSSSRRCRPSRRAAGRARSRR